MSPPKPSASRSLLGPKMGSIKKQCGFQPHCPKVRPKSASEAGVFHLLATSMNPPAPTTVLHAKRYVSSRAPVHFSSHRLLIRRPGGVMFLPQFAIPAPVGFLPMARYNLTVGFP